MFTILFALLAMLGWTPGPSTTNATAANTAATNTCYCQTMPGKDWGK
jgi:hypothetical protein